MVFTQSIWQKFCILDTVKLAITCENFINSFFHTLKLYLLTSYFLYYFYSGAYRVPAVANYTVVSFYKIFIVFEIFPFP